MNYPDFIRALNPIAYWRLGEPAGAKGMSDVSGNGHGGSYDGTYYLGQTGGLDGDSDKATRFTNGHGLIDYQAALNLNGNFSIVCLLKANTTAAGQWPGPIVNGSSATANGYCFLYDTNANAYLQRNAVNCPIGAGVEIGAWHHLVFTYDGTHCRGYKDGALTNTTEVTFPANNNSGDIKVGYGLTAGDFVLDELALFNTTLSAGEIAAAAAIALGDTLPYEIAGNVDDGDAVACAVRAYRRDTGAFLGETTSSGSTGDYTLELPYAGDIDVIAQGPSGARPLAHGPVTPITI